MYQKGELGCAAKAYVRLQISRGTTLGNAPCQLPLEAGRVIAFVPPYASSWDLMHFKLGLNTLQRHAEDRVDAEYRARECEVLRGIVNKEGRAALLYRDTVQPDSNFHVSGAVAHLSASTHVSPFEGH